MAARHCPRWSCTLVWLSITWRVFAAAPLETTAPSSPLPSSAPSFQSAGSVRQRNEASRATRSWGETSVEYALAPTVAAEAPQAEAVCGRSVAAPTPVARVRAVRRDGRESAAEMCLSFM